MRKLLSVIVLLAGFSSLADQIVLRVPNEDFNPIKKAQWKVMVGSASTNFSEGDYDRSARGLGISLEREVYTHLNLGLQYANLKSNTVHTFNKTERQEYSESVNALAAYGKYSFVNYDVNRWNLLQLNLIGGAQAVERMNPNAQLIYGASISYNYDNTLGFEVDSKINMDAESFSSANLIGYF